MRLVLAAGRSGPALAKLVQVAVALAGIPPDAMLPDSAVLDLVVADRAVLPLHIPPAAGQYEVTLCLRPGRISATRPDGRMLVTSVIAVLIRLRRGSAAQALSALFCRALLAM